MGRGKLSMELIRKEKTRMVTYHKRKKGLMKKAYEFSTLCGVDACVVVFGPKLKDRTPPEVETWPKNPDHVRAIIKKYRLSETPNNMLRKKTDHLSDFFAVQKTKIEKEIEALRKANMEALFTRWDDRLECWSLEKLGILGDELEIKLDAAKERFLVLKSEQHLGNQHHQMKEQLQKNMELEALQQRQQQSMCYVKPLLNMSLPPAYYNPIDQAALLRLQFGFPNNNSNSNSTMMIMMPTKGEDMSYFHGSPSSAGYIPFTPLNASSAYYDPANENMMMFNNPRPLSVYDYGPATHPVPFYGQNFMTVPNGSCPQMQAPQFSDFLNLNGRGMDNRKHKF